MFITISTSDENGQYRPSFAVEVDGFHVHGFTDGGMLVDLRHMDGEKERVFVGGESRPFSPMSWQAAEMVQGITLTSGYPATEVLTKDEFHARVGKGATLNGAGHFEGASKRPASKQAVLNEMVRRHLDGGWGEDAQTIDRNLRAAFKDVMGYCPSLEDEEA